MEFAPSEKLAIVIADDDPDDQYLIQKAIRECNIHHSVTAVYNGLQLMDYLLRKNMYVNCSEPTPDCVLLDLKMPLLNGLQAMERIRRHEELKSIPVFIMCGNEPQKENEKLLEMGAAGFLFKKNEPKSLQALMKAILLEIKQGKKNHSNTD